MSTGRRTALAVLLLTLGPADGTAAQTTTTTSTTVAATTSTTEPNPCTGQPCTERPPHAFLAGASGEVRLPPGGYCWRGPVPNAQGQLVGVCTASSSIDPPVTLVVRRGETLTMRFEAPGGPTQVQFSRNGAVTTLGAGNPVRFRADFPSGFQTLEIATRWLQGDVFYPVRLDVRAAATPRTGTNIALTG